MISKEKILKMISNIAVKRLLYQHTKDKARQIGCDGALEVLKDIINKIDRTGIYV